jgi:hypothetical protein
MRRRRFPTHGCGCCGRAIAESKSWCRPCEGHLAPDDRPVFDRTYFAQHQRPCPYDPFRGSDACRTRTEEVL